ncbi:MAG TPA: transposase [Atribacterota bacterium]|nr:transposase [Atribacterota bacterium]
MENILETIIDGEKNERQQFSFSTYEAYKKIKKNDPLKMILESIDWSFINPLVKDRYYNNKILIYSPVSLFKAQLLIYLGEIDSNRQLAEVLRYNTKYCVLCGFHHFLKTPAHSTFSAFRKRIGSDLFHKIMHRLVAQSVPMISKKLSYISPQTLHLTIYSREGEIISCNCKGKCKMEKIITKNNKEINKKNFVIDEYRVKLYIDRKSYKPFAAELRPK